MAITGREHPDWFLRGEDPAYIGPGPEERKLKSRITFKLTGRWPQAVVSERLRREDMHLRDLGLWRGRR